MRCSGYICGYARGPIPAISDRNHHAASMMLAISLHTYPVASHDRVFLLPIGIREQHIHAFRVLCAQLEDVAHLDAALSASFRRI